MRIIAGTWRGRTIEAPPGQSTRPTADRVRETLFSMLVSRLGDFEGLSVLDLFAGSGALGLEALSRGAASCHFVEQDGEALRALRANVDALAQRGTATVQAGSVMALGPARSTYDLVLLDPPYGTGAGRVALDRLLRLGWIGPQTWVSLETDAKETIAISGLTIESERKVGKAKLTLMRQQA